MFGWAAIPATLFLCTATASSNSIHLRDQLEHSDSSLFASSNDHVSIAITVNRPFFVGPKSLRAVSRASTPSILPITETLNGVTEYSGVVQVGTPPVSYSVLFDTGSFSTWLFGSECKNQYCRANLRYNLTKSSTGKSIGRQIGQSYADGTEFNGTLVQDVVSVGNYSVSDFVFAQVTSFDSPSEARYDGIVGMGFHPTDDSPTLPEVLMANGVLTKPWFSWYIGVDEVNGFIGFGGFDAGLLANPSKELVWISMITDNDLIRAGKIALPMVSVSVGGVVVEKFSSHASPLTTETQGSTGAASWDTGTSAAVVSDVLIRAIGNQIAGAKQVGFTGSDDFTFRVPCNMRREAGGPVLAISFDGGVTLNITALEYILSPDSYDTCYLGLIGRVGGYRNGTYLVGNTFLKRYMNVFDYSQKRIGFGLANGRSSSIADVDVGQGGAAVKSEGYTVSALLSLSVFFSVIMT